MIFIILAVNIKISTKINTFFINFSPPFIAKCVPRYEPIIFAIAMGIANIHKTFPAITKAIAEPTFVAKFSGLVEAVAII